MVYSDATGDLMDKLVNEQLDLFGNADTYNNLNKETKVCKICQKEKSLDLFYKMGITTLDNRCKACHKKQMSFKKEQKELHWHKNTGSCDCCGYTPEKKSSLCWDHDHETLRHRGFLCSACNTGIGKLNDNIEGVTKALHYLEKHYKSKRPH